MDLLSIYELLKRLIIEKQYISSTLKKSIKDESSDELLEVCISHNHDVSNLFVGKRPSANVTTLAVSTADYVK